MKPGTVVGFVICVLVVCCLFTHRRVMNCTVRSIPRAAVIIG